jgi:hypothetical protein
MHSSSIQLTMGKKKVETQGEPARDSILAGECRITARAIQKEKIEIQGGHGSSAARPPRYRPPSPRAHHHRKAFEEAQAQEKLEGITRRGIGRAIAG